MFCIPHLLHRKGRKSCREERRERIRKRESGFFFFLFFLPINRSCQVIQVQGSISDSSVHSRRSASALVAMGGVEGGDKKPLPLDWAALLPDSDDPMPELIVTSRECQSPVECSASVDSDQSAFVEIESLTDQKLEESIASKSRTLQTVGSKLSDGGVKLRGMLNRLLEERKRRKLHQNGKVALILLRFYLAFFVYLFNSFLLCLGSWWKLDYHFGFSVSTKK